LIRGEPIKKSNVRTNVILTRIRVITVALGKPLVFQTLSLPATLVMQHAMRMRRIVLLSVACLTVPHSPTLSHKRHDIQKKKLIEYKNCFDFLYNFCLKRCSF
jgi:hypothetical protein